MIINLTHGNGGQETSRLIDEVFMKYFKNDAGTAKEDAVVLNTGRKIAFTTDSFVVKPIFFNGGDIGRLAVCGTVNDILTSGATPKYISAAFIISEGVDTDVLEKIALSMREAADEAGVFIVTGDTKVVDGSGDIYINTSGIGEITHGHVNARNIGAGDKIIVTGKLGDHQACILSVRMGIKNDVASDVAPLNSIVNALQTNGITVNGLRDITRGGLATCLNEIAEICGLRASLYEANIPVGANVSGFCDILGLDPVYMACEGKLMVIVPEGEAERALSVIRKAKYGEAAEIVGEFSEGRGVVMNTRIGGKRNLPPLRGDSLPRIC